MTSLAAIRATVGPEYLTMSGDGLGTTTAVPAIQASVVPEYLMVAGDEVKR
jgi:hypothetical protein